MLGIKMANVVGKENPISQNTGRVVGSICKNIMPETTHVNAVPR